MYSRDNIYGQMYQRPAAEDSSGVDKPISANMRILLVHLIGQVIIEHYEQHRAAGTSACHLCAGLDVWVKMQLPAYYHMLPQRLGPLALPARPQAPQPPAVLPILDKRLITPLVSSNASLLIKVPPYGIARLWGHPVYLSLRAWYTAPPRVLRPGSDDLASVCRALGMILTAATMPFGESFGTWVRSLGQEPRRPLEFRVQGPDPQYGAAALLMYVVSDGDRLGPLLIVDGWDAARADVLAGYEWDIAHGGAFVLPDDIPAPE